MVSKVERMVTNDMNRRLDMVFTRPEVDAALSQMAPDKAHGLDGFNAAFYKEHWSILGDEISSIVLDVLNNGSPLDAINGTNIV